MEANVHEFKGKVLAKSQRYPVGSNGMNKSFLYMEGDYVVSGKPRTQQSKFTCFSFGDNKSKIEDVLPGDVVRFNFTLSGWYKPDEKDYLGAPKCFTDPVIDSKVEILNISERVYYDNKVDSKDNLGIFPMPNTSPISQRELPEDDATNDLPF